MPARIDKDYTPFRTHKPSSPIPSRRSSRVPANSIENGSSSVPDDDLSSISSERSFSRAAETPHKNRHASPRQTKINWKRAELPEESKARRRSFQPRPSGLSNVYTPAVEASGPTTEDRRMSRRPSLLQTPTAKQRPSDAQHATEQPVSLDWSFDQSLSDLDDSPAPHSPTASSKRMRSSTRSRKPTMRAMEAMQSTQKTRGNKMASSSHPSSASPPQATEEEATPAPAMNPPSNLRSSQKATPSKGGKTKAQTKADKKKALQARWQRTKFTKRLLAIVEYALSPEFDPDDDPEWTIQETRNNWSNKRNHLEKPAGTAHPAEAVDQNQPNLYDSESDEVQEGEKPFSKNASPEQALSDKNIEQQSSIQKPAAKARKTLQRLSFKAPKPPESEPPVEKRPLESGSSDPQVSSFLQSLDIKSEPQITGPGWANTGRVNEHGEEVLLFFTPYTLYRSPKTYSSPNMLEPPIRVRSQEQVQADEHLGFPPLFGDRNLPFDGPTTMETEGLSAPEDTKSAQSEGKGRRRSGRTNLSGVQTLRVNPPGKPTGPRLRLTLKPAVRQDQQAENEDSSPRQEGSSVKGKSRKRRAAALSDDSEPTTPNKRVVSSKGKKGSRRG